MQQACAPMAQILHQPCVSSTLKLRGVRAVRRFTCHARLGPVHARICPSAVPEIHSFFTRNPKPPKPLPPPPPPPPPPPKKKKKNSTPKTPKTLSPKTQLEEARAQRQAHLDGSCKPCRHFTLRAEAWLWGMQGVEGF